MSTTDETQCGCRDWITYSIHLYHQFKCWCSLKQSVINPNCTLSTTSNLSHYLTKELCVSADPGHCSYAWTVTSRQSLCLLCIIEHDPGQDCSQFIAGIFPFLCEYLIEKCLGRIVDLHICIDMQFPWNFSLFIWPTCAISKVWSSAGIARTLSALFW